MGKVYCLMVSGIPFSSVVSEELMRIARRMAHTGSSVGHIRMDDAEGQITTQFKHASLVSISGVVFHADLETIRGNTQADYIVRTADLRSDDEDGEWTDWLQRPLSPHPYN